MSLKRTFFVLFLAAAAVRGDIASRSSGPVGDWEKNPGLTVKSDGYGILSGGRAESRTGFSVNAFHTYRISGEFRLNGNSAKTRLYFGVIPLDSEGREIRYYHVTPVPGMPLAELAAPLKKNDRAAILKGAEKWPARKTYLLAFGARKGNRDLPNFRLSPPLASEGLVKQPDGTVKAVFSAPSKAEAAAGTAVRLHQDGETYIYAGANRRKITDQWQTFSGSFSLDPADGPGHALFPKTAAVKTVIFLTDAGKGEKLEFRNIRLDSIPTGTRPANAAKPKFRLNPEWNRRPFEIISGELSKPHCPTLLHMEQLDPARCRIAGNAVFSLTSEAVTWRNQAGRLDIPEGGGTYSVFFPAPVKVTDKADGFELWTKGPKSVYVQKFYVEYTDAAGKTGRVQLFGGSNRLFGNVWWQPAAGKLAGGTRFPLNITGLTFVLPPKTKADSIIFDTLGAFRFEKIELPDTSKTPMPFPVTSDSILPGIPGEQYSLETKNRSRVCEWLVKSGSDTIIYRYTPKTGTLSDIEVVFAGKHHFRPTVNGGPIARISGKNRFPAVDPVRNDSPVPREPHVVFRPGDPNIKAELLSFQFRNGRADTRWRWLKNGRQLEFTLSFYVKNRSLAVETSSDMPCITAFDCGVTGDTPDPRLFSMAYLHNRWSRIRMLVTDDYFLSVLPDWHRSNASFLVESFNAFDLPKSQVVDPRSARVAGGCCYIPKTDGTLNPLAERIYITVSGKAEAVLPNIPNPRSRFFDEMKQRVCTIRMYELRAPDDLSHEISFWRKMHAYGVTDLFLRYHAGQFRTPFASNRFNHSLTGAQYVGGDQAFLTLVKEMKKLFPRVAPYEDNRIMSALSPDFRYAFIGQESNGSFSLAWDHAFKPNPSSQLLLQAGFSPKFIEKYGWNACYLDELSNSPPWAQVDFNAAAPGAGMFREVLRNYGYLILQMKEYYQGPVWSEGNAAYFYAGLMDTDYADSNTAGEIPLIDFKLLKFNPLENAAGFDKTRIKGNVDELLANEILFGNIGMLHQRHSITQARKINEAKQRIILKSYFMIRQLQEFYCGVKPAAIEYWVNGRFVTATELLRKNLVNSGLIRVRYENGLTVHVNRSKSDNWPVVLGGTEYLLPPFGYAAFLPGKILVYSALVDGERVDYSRGPKYIYADGHGRQIRFPEFTAGHGYLIQFGNPPGSAWLIPMPGQGGECLSGLKFKNAMPCDQEKRELKDSAPADGSRLAIDGKAFCYRLDGLQLPALVSRKPQHIGKTAATETGNQLKDQPSAFFYGDENPGLQK